jgi:hypothetical protein
MAGTETKQEVFVHWAETTSYASNYLFPRTVIVWCQHVMWALVDGGWWVQVGRSGEVGAMMVT